MIRTHLACLTTAAWFGMTGSGYTEIKLPEQIEITPRQERPGPTINVPAAEDVDRTGPPRQVDPPQPDALHLFKKKPLRGRLVSVLPGEFVIKWQPTGVVNPIQVNLKGVSSVTMAARGEINDKEPGASVWLTNDDLLTGKLVSLDDRELVLDTWYAGRMRIVRPMVRAIRSKTFDYNVVYSGPQDLDAWTIDTSRQWALNADALTFTSVPGSIGRNIPGMPDVANIEFSVGGDRCASFAFSFCSDATRNEPGNCYVLDSSERSGFLWRSDFTSHNSVNMGNFKQDVPNSIAGGNTRYNLLVNKPEKTIYMMINDELVKHWNDKHGFAGLGDRIVFQPKCSNKMALRNIRVTKWDGEIPYEHVEDFTLAADPIMDDAITDDAIRFANKDQVTGRVLGIADGKVSFKYAQETLSVPLTRMEVICFSGKQAGRARRNKTDVRATFAAAGSITIGISKIEDNLLVGASENFGEVRIPLHAFKKIDFNISGEPVLDGEEQDSL